MRIRVNLPKVEPDVYEERETCPYGCGCTYFKPHGVQGEPQPLRDPQYSEVQCYRKTCGRCGRSFRVYPRGVSSGPQSERLQGMMVLLYVLGLSYGAIEDFTQALGCGVGKTTAYNNGQAGGSGGAAEATSHSEKGVKRAVLGADGTYVRLKGEPTGIEVVVDDARGELLGLEIIVSENSEESIDVIRSVAEDVDAEVLVSDEHGAYQEGVDELGVAHQLCRRHVKENVEALADELADQLGEHEPPPEASDLTPEQLVDYLEQMRRLVWQRPTEGEEQLEKLYARYCECLIGWWIKERYRLMRGYKREESIKNVVTLTARMGVRSGHYEMSELYA